MTSLRIVVNRIGINTANQQRVIKALSIKPKEDLPSENLRIKLRQALLVFKLLYAETTQEYEDICAYVVRLLDDSRQIFRKIIDTTGSLDIITLVSEGYKY